MKALHAALAVDERAGRFGERRNRQQHVGVAHRRAELAQHDDEIGLLERRPRGNRIRAVEFRLGMQHEIRVPRFGAVRAEHRLRVQAILLRQRPGNVAADGVGGLGADAKRSAGDRCERLCEGDDL